MYFLIEEVSKNLIECCDETLKNNDIIDISDLVSRYTTDAISTIIFGFNGKNLSEPNNEFKRYADIALNMSPIKHLIFANIPILFDILRIPYFGKEVTEFFSKTFRDAVNFRRESNVVRKDFLNLVIQLLNNDGKRLGKDKDGNFHFDSDSISMNEVQAQAFVFFVAGFETTSTVMACFLYQIALNPNVQEEVYQEIDEFFTRGQINYSRIQNELTYLDMVISETMRMHPSLPILNRFCNTDWKIPDSDITIKRGTVILIPANGLHYDSDTYPNPEKFDPTRFSNNSARSSYFYMSFGKGPKNCIGTKLALLQMKIGLLSLIARYKFFKCDKTQIPLQSSKRTFIQIPDSGVYLRLEKRLK